MKGIVRTSHAAARAALESHERIEGKNVRPEHRRRGLRPSILSFLLLFLLGGSLLIPGAFGSPDAQDTSGAGDPGGPTDPPEDTSEEPTSLPDETSSGTTLPGSTTLPPSTTSTIPSSTSTSPPPPPDRFIEAENYSAAHDRSESNLFVGSLRCTLRNDDVDLKAIGSGGCAVGHFSIGEWLEYDVPPGEYRMRLRVFSADFGAFHIEVDRVDVTGSVAVPTTSPSWQDVSWTVIETPAFRTDGKLRIVNQEEYWDFDRFELVPASAPPTPTTSTTTTQPPQPPPPPSPGPGAYGAGSVGPGGEACLTDGIVVDGGNYPGAINNAAAGSTLLLRGGTYGKGFTIPAGKSNAPTVVKPYNCEAVTINHSIDMNSWTTVAGFTIKSSGDNWTIELERDSGTAMTNVVIRNNKIRGGEVEAIRIARNVRNVDITSNDLDGGKKRHVLKVHWEESNWRPTNIRIVNNVFHKNETGSGTDLIQLEGHQTVLIERNTFHKGATENGVDVKRAGAGGGVTIRRNYFDGATIKQGCLLVQGDFANNIVDNNYFDNGCSVVLGAHPEGKNAPWWRFENNVIDDNGTLQIRRSFNAEIINNIMVGGTFKLGLSGEDDYPRDAVIVGNTFTDVLLADRVTPNGGNYTCQSNLLTDVSGDWSRCQ